MIIWAKLIVSNKFLPETKVVFLVPEDRLLFCIGKGFKHSTMKDESLEFVLGWCLCTNENNRWIWEANLQVVQNGFN